MASPRKGRGSGGYDDVEQQQQQQQQQQLSDVKDEPLLGRRKRMSKRFKYGLIGGGVAVAIAVAVVILTTVILRKSGRVTLGPTAATALPKSINTVILGDWGREGDDNQIDVAIEMARAANATNASFVISVGDNFYNSGVASTSDPQWQTSWSRIYNQPSVTDVPFYAVLGNHDYRGNTDAQVEYTQVNSRWQMPQRNFTVRHQVPDGSGHCLSIVFIDTCPFIPEYDGNSKMPDLSKQDPAAQEAWIAATLAQEAAACKWLLVVGHHPVYSAGPNGDQPGMIAHVLPHLKANQVAAYISGHDHDLQHLNIGGMDFIVTGAGSNPSHKMDSSKPGLVFGLSKTPGFVSLSLNAAQARFQYLGHTGALLHTATVTTTP